MKAIVLTAYGSVEKLELRDVLEPIPGPNEIKVRMAGASLNPVDWKLRSGALQAMMPLTLPAILGRDVSGTVVELGPGVSRFAVGDRVMGLVSRAHAEFAVAPIDAWAPVPANMDFVDASALPLILLTGAQLIEDGVRPKEGDVVLVTGAVGSVGRVAVFVAKNRGATVWAGVRGAQKVAAGSLGADGVIALDDDADLSKLPPLDAIADTVGGAGSAQILEKLKPRGTIASVVGEPSGAKEQGFFVRALWTHGDADRLAALGQLVANEKIVVPIAKRFPLAQAREAYAFAEHHAGGKVLLVG